MKSLFSCLLLKLVILKNICAHFCFSVHFLDLFLSEGKLPTDEPAVLPPLPLAVPKNEKRKSVFGTPQSRKPDYNSRDWDRERDRDFELMPPPGSLKKEFAAPVDIDQPIDPNEPTYCVCNQVLVIVDLFYSLYI